MTSELHRDTRGAVYVEFLVAFMPLFLFFLALVEMTFFYSAKLLTQYAASRAARAAIVVIPEDMIFYADGGNGAVATAERLREIRDAAQIPLGVSDDRRVRVNFGSGRGEGAVFGRGDVLTVQVEFDYRCHVMIIDSLLCWQRDAEHKRFRTIVAQASHQLQGAMYGYNGEAQ